MIYLMSTSYTKSLSSDFSGNLNIQQLYCEVEENGNIGPDIITIMNIGDDNVEIVFDSALSAGEQTTLDSLIGLHDPSLALPRTINTTLAAGAIYTANHFSDPTDSRKITIYELNTDTYDDTAYEFKSSESSNYTLSNPTHSELTTTSFCLIGSGSFTEGANIADGGTASASSSQQPASNGNDGSNSTFWYNASGQPPNGSWWKVDLGSVTNTYGAELVWYNTAYYSINVLIEYSNDDSNWATALHDTGVLFTSAGAATGTYKFASFSSPIAARYFRFTFNGALHATYVVVYEFRLFSADDSGFPTGENGTVSNVGANKQIDTTIWDTINSSTLNATVPANTSVKVLLSFDNQSTWVYWNGSAWTTSSLANITTSSMTHTVFNGLLEADYAAANGLNSSTNTLDLACNISTTDVGVTPIVNSATFNITTKQFKELLMDSSIRTRLVSNQKTEFKNVTGSSKDLIIQINNPE